MTTSSIDILPPDGLTALRETLDDVSKLQLLREWPFLARAGQRAPAGDWKTWLILAGRGFGKTRTGAEWIRERVVHGGGRLGLIGPTHGDVRDIMVEGESGLLSVCGKADRTLFGHLLGRPFYEPSKRRVTWANGAFAALYSADDPERLRGPQHEAIWADELAAWRDAQNAWDMAMFGLRLGRDPRACVTTTPRPLKLLHALLGDAATATTRGTSFDNAVNLAPGFLAAVTARYGDSRLGRQEILAQLVKDAEGALWTHDRLDARRRARHPPLARIVVAVDPPAGSKASSDACGIVAAGLDEDRRCWVIADETVRAATPAGWAAKAVALYERLQADLIVAEVNQGGDMVEAVIRQVDARVALKKVHATRGKHLRAEPVAALYEQEKVFHAGSFPELEDEMCDFTADGLTSGRSPDRLDALVWAVSELMLGQRGEPRVRGL